jgi:hypothetical protein
LCQMLLSKKARGLVKRYYDLEAWVELKEAEGEIDRTVAGLYGITDEELAEAKKTLGILRGEDVEEEEGEKSENLVG